MLPCPFQLKSGNHTLNSVKGRWVQPVTAAPGSRADSGYNSIYLTCRLKLLPLEY